MEITPALALGRRLLREHGLEHWSITTDRAKTRAGVCRFAGRTISLSAPLTRLHDEVEVRDTILHEIAHALVGPSHGHDDVWRAKAMAIGCSGERTLSTSAPSVEGPWRGECPQGHAYSRHRRPGRVMSCLTCSPEFDATALLTWTYQGRRVDMGEAYREELDRVIAARGEVPARPVPRAVPARVSNFPIGSYVRIVAAGPMNGAIGEVEAAFLTRSQVRVGDELYAVPNEALASAELVAS
ncbi:phage-related protein [Janibacter sp. HTCC2649]|uniref:SprT-like domain-containing protein n=1 Tax=Janibacter sp. HTCC2649 TaxID=313589 RepID=UPI000066E99A|nr:SprT-like domain-containing protein [Janibacter sp. HTCC2649]EAP98589.1 phage-related protein [Janibacter sp. HTCC2649]